MSLAQTGYGSCLLVIGLEEVHITISLGEDGHLGIPLGIDQDLLHQGEVVRRMVVAQLPSRSSCISCGRPRVCPPRSSDCRHSCQQGRIFHRGRAPWRIQVDLPRSLAVMPLVLLTKKCK